MPPRRSRSARAPRAARISAQHRTRSAIGNQKMIASRMARCGGVARRGGREVGRAPFRLAGELDRPRARPAISPSSASVGIEDGRRQQVRRGAGEKALEAQPEIEADAAVHPRDEQQRELHPFHVRAS